MRIIITSILMGIGLAMDACAVSMANGLKHPKLKFDKILFISLMFGLFQGIMPLTGYFIGNAILSKIVWIIPIVAVTLLSYVGLKMIEEGIHTKEETSNFIQNLSIKLITIQAFATSIDALTVGFSISNYTLLDVLFCIFCIACITFVLCFIGAYIGKKFGCSLGDKAQIFGGIILICIGIEIFITSMFF